MFSSLHAEFSAYPQTVQVNYLAAARANLGASGKIPTDIKKFGTTVRSAYNVALLPPYVEAFDKYGFGQERLTGARYVLDQLAEADLTCKAAHTSAQAATEMRDKAGGELDAWIRKFPRLAKTTLKAVPSF